MGSPRKTRRTWTWLKAEQSATAFALLLVACSMAFAWLHLAVVADQQADAMASRIAASLTQDTSRTIEQLDATLLRVIGRRQSTADPKLPPLERNALLAERAPQDRYIDFVEVLGQDGGVLAATRPGQELNNWANRDYFTAQRNGTSNDPFIGRPFATAHENTAAIPISRRITDGDGQFAGVAVIGFRLAYFRDLFTQLQLGPHDSVTLLSDDGVILMRLPFDPNDINRTVDAAAPFHTFMRTGATQITARDPGDGLERTVFRRVGSLPLVVSVSIAPDAVGGWWLAAIGAAVAAAVVLLMRRIWGESRGRHVAERESREKSRFLTTLSHELRTPLHGVLGYATELSHDTGLSAAQSGQVTEIIRASKRMRDAVNLVLDYARIEALGPALHMRRLDVRQLIDECMAVVEPGARARGLTTRITAASGAPTHFVTDDVQFRQILMNLLSNAVKYTPQGMVEVRQMGDDEHLRIEVADTGIGIPEGQRHLLFTEFNRFGTERTSIEGTGLGLAIAHRLVRRMGGHLGHRNNLAGGSVFWFELPAGAPDVVDAAAPVEGTAAECPLHILVADDSRVNRELALAFLRNAGHVVDEADDGESAVRLAAAQDYDVVLMDMLMPGIDGLEATRQIRALDGRRGKVPIVAVTANALDQHAEECRRAGMSEHLAKPFNRTELAAVVARAAARRHAAPRATEAVIDADSMAQVAAAMTEESLERLLDLLALRIEVLLRRLDGAETFASLEDLGNLAHELVGSGGTLGFTRLASAARRFEAAIATGAADEAEIRDEALAALSELRRRRLVEKLVSQ